MSTKTASVTLCAFNNVYNPPSGGALYVHTLNMSNGDIGKIYAKTQNPPELMIGKVLTYTINEKSQIKVVETPNPAATVHSTDRKPQQHRPADIIGLSFSYAKDLLVAQITAGTKFKAGTNIADELVKIAEPIYKKMAEIRELEKQKEDNQQ